MGKSYFLQRKITQKIIFYIILKYTVFKPTHFFLLSENYQYIGSPMLLVRLSKSHTVISPKVRYFY
jgi:hypothetical protein